MKKILVIEDDWNFQALLSVFLCENGFEVESADGSEAGLKNSLCSLPDLILMDYDLGEMSGHDAAFWLEYMKGGRCIPACLNIPHIAEFVGFMSGTAATARCFAMTQR